MNLLSDLVLDAASLDGVPLIPTKDFFKAVLVISAPACAADAALLGAEWIFDADGNARLVDGAIKLHGELAGAQLTIGTPTLERVIKTEKVGRFAFYREEKIGMFIRLRAHLPEAEPLGELVAFLAAINKSPFRIVVSPAQGTLIRVEVATLIGKGDPEYKPAAPSEDGHFDVEKASKRPFQQGKLKVVVFVIETEQGFRSSWTMLSGFERGAFTTGEALTVDRLPFPSDSQARELAASEIWLKLPLLLQKGKKETDAKQALESWLCDLCPGLARATREPEASPKEVLQ